MRKKLKVLFWLAAVALLAFYYTMPRMVQSSIPSSYYITPSRTTYENLVSCSGMVQSAHVRSVYVESPVVPDAVFVEVGQRVEQGQLLATLDAEKTGRLASLGSLQTMAPETLLLQQNVSVDWASLAAAYGMTASVSGGGQYAQQLEGILQDAAGIVPDRFSAVDAVSGIYAPISGVVTDVALYENIPALSGRSVVTISDDTQYKVTAAVPEADIAKIVPGDRATVRGVAFASSVYYGSVVKIAPTARKMLGTSAETVVDVEILLDSADENLRPGYSAKVEIAGAESYELLTVPYEAIRQDENNDEYVYVYEDGRIKKAHILTGRELTNEVQVLGGISGDSIVVYNPSDVIREGAMVHLKGRADAA